MKTQSFAQSNPMQISFVLDLILQLHSDSVLDIGCGGGKYGLLIREKSPTARIDAIEGFAPYVTDVHRTIYDNVYVTNAIDAVPKLDQLYNLAIMIDMFEHLTPEDGRALLDELKKHATHVLISVPTWHPEQDAYGGNVLQEHHAQYSVASLRRLGFHQIWRISGNYIALFGPTKLKLKRKTLRVALTCCMPLWVSRLLAPISRKLSSSTD